MAASTTASDPAPAPSTTLNPLLASPTAPSGSAATSPPTTATTNLRSPASTATTRSARPHRVRSSLRIRQRKCRPIALKLRRIWGTTGTVTVHYTTGGGDAIPGVHYTAASGTVSFANGETEKTIFINPIDDTSPSSNRSCRVTLSAPTGGAVSTNSPPNRHHPGKRSRHLVRRIAAREHWTPTEDFSVSENVGTAFFHVYFVGDRPAPP
jgi:hypothetical protein